MRKNIKSVKFKPLKTASYIAKQSSERNMRAETRDHEKRKIYTKEKYKWKQENWLKKS